MNTIEDRTPKQPPSRLAKPVEDIPRFLSLRAKFSLFVSLVIILVCTGLSGFLIQQEAKIMTRSLLNTGTILVKTLDKVSLNRLIIHDTDYLEKMLEGPLAAPEVVYALIRNQDGRMLVSQSKGILTNASEIIRDHSQPLLPDNTHTTPLFSQQPDVSGSKYPLMTKLHTIESEGTITLQPSGENARPRPWAVSKETIYDFALPVYRQPRSSTTTDLLSSETLGPSPASPPPPGAIIGMIQVGISTTHMQNALNQTVWKIGLLTFGIIVVGIGLTLLLTNRITTPMRELAKVAHQIAEGNIYVSVLSDTQDEVGQLTHSINQMAKGLQQREIAITTYLNTITKQVTQLSTLHQTGTIITSTLDMEKLFAIVLKLLQKNLEFERMILVLFKPDQQKGVLTEVVGLPSDLEQQLKGFEFPIAAGSLDEMLLIQGSPVLAFDIEEIAPRMNPTILPLCRQTGVISFVSAPLISHQRILGYLSADKGHSRCTQEDLDLLVTIANHVAVAIDNARTYQDLETLAQNLEQRVVERTEDLQAANERLQ